MNNTPVGTGDGFEVVVGDDGGLMVPADELASHGAGFSPTLIPTQQAAERKPMAGALAGSVSVEAVEELIQGLEHAKAERVAYYRRTAG